MKKKEQRKGCGALGKVVNEAHVCFALKTERLAHFL